MKNYILQTMLMLLLLIPVTASAQLTESVVDKMDDHADALTFSAGIDDTVAIGEVLSTVIKAFLSMLGIIFIVLVLIAGYNWMTAAGEEDKVNKAKSTLKRAIIGLIIILTSYALTAFAFNHLT